MLVDTTPLQTDVLICGGGPAGASTALCILQYTELSVTVIEQSAFEKNKVGEQVSPALFDLLKYMDIDPKLLPQDMLLPGHTHMAAWGNDKLLARHSMNSVAGESYQLNREHFDLMLVEQAAARGAQVFPRTRITHMEQAESGDWNVACRHKTKGSFDFQARYLIDATGRNAFVGRSLDLPFTKLDQLVGVGAMLNFDADHKIPEVVLETVPEGWWYAAPLPNQRMTVTFFTDADLVKKLDLGNSATWREYLSQTNYVKQKTSKGKSFEPLWVKNAFSRVVDPSSYRRFLPVGDAAVAFDPLSSMGIGFAISSGCHAARALAADLKGESAAVRAYQDSLQSNFKELVERLQGYYGMEKRWPKAPFWQSRKVAAKMAIP